MTGKSRAAKGAAQIAAFISPKNMRVLKDAGVLAPRGLLGVAANLPWLLGRGPSLGIVSAMNRVSLPNKVALIDAEGSLTFSQLDKRANQVARLLADLGLKPSERVVTLLRNGRHQLEVLLAGQKLGLTVSPLNTWSSKPEIEALLAATKPSLIVYDVRHRDLVSPMAQSLSVGDPSRALPATLDLETEMARFPRAPVAPFTLSASSPEVVIHTSGTTGTPKGARRDPAAAGVDSLSRLLEVVPLHRDDVILCPAPLFHSFGLATFTVASVIGATLVLPDRFDPTQTLELVEDHAATVLAMVPVMLNRLLALGEDEIGSRRISSVRIILVSGSALGETTRSASRRVFGDVLYDLYGSTEVGWVGIADPTDMVRKPGSVGRPVPGVELAIFDESGRRQPSGVPGEIFVRSDITFEGYTSGETKQIRDGFMSIGDVGRLDDEGYLYIEGRADEMMVIGGENVYPIEIEQVIATVPGVADVAVLGLPDDQYGTRAAAFVVGSAGEGAILDSCRSALASFKVPRDIYFLEELPRNATGKVLKRELLDRV